jgi:hypothetical protein
MLLSGSRGHASPRLESQKNMSFSTPILESQGDRELVKINTIQMNSI